MSEIPRHEASDPIDAMKEALDAAGCLVVTDVADAAARERVRKDLEPHMPEASSTDDPESFYPAHTRRTTALVARSEQAREFAVHPISKALTDHHLGPTSRPAVTCSRTCSQFGPR